MVKTSWVYLLRKEELITYLQEFGLATTGTIDDLRKRLVTFSAETELSREHKFRLGRLESRHAKSTSPNPAATIVTRETQEMEKPGTSAGASQTARSEDISRTPQDRTASRTAVSQQLHDTVSYAAIVDRVRKWSLNFDGGRDPLGFIERVEELAEMYGVDTDFLPRTMPELLRDRALLWYRNNNRAWREWSTFRKDFLKFFLPSRYFEELDDQIRQRCQRSGEEFKQYVLELQNLMRHVEYSEEQKLERIFRNSLPEYQMYVRRRLRHAAGAHRDGRGSGMHTWRARNSEDATNTTESRARSTSRSAE